MGKLEEINNIRIRCKANCRRGGKGGHIQEGRRDIWLLECLSRIALRKYGKETPPRKREISENVIGRKT
jgi:hypothetical protein